MRRLIDACKVIEKINGAIEILGIASKTSAENEGFQTTIKAYKDVRDAIMQEPTAEPEIIRCKDCKYKYVDGDNVKFNLCALNHNKVQSDDWYCADAEREESDV